MELPGLALQISLPIQSIRPQLKALATRRQGTAGLGSYGSGRWWCTVTSLVLTRITVAEVFGYGSETMGTGGDSSTAPGAAVTSAKTGNNFSEFLLGTFDVSFTSAPAGAGINVVLRSSGVADTKAEWSEATTVATDHDRRWQRYGQQGWGKTLVYLAVLRTAAICTPL